MAAKKKVKKKTTKKKAATAKKTTNKPATKKATAKKTTKKTAATAAKKTFSKVEQGKARSMSNIIEELSKSVEGMTKANVKQILITLGDITQHDLKTCGKFKLPGIANYKTVKKPATKARMGINPFTKEEMMFKAKPASTNVKILALKGLKDGVNKKK